MPTKKSDILTKGKRKKRPMEPRVEEGLMRALKAQGISREEFEKQFSKKELNR